MVYVVICEEFIKFQFSNSKEDPGRQKGGGGEGI